MSYNGGGVGARIINGNDFVGERLFFFLQFIYYYEWEEGAVRCKYVCYCVPLPSTTWSRSKVGFFVPHLSN